MNTKIEKTENKNEIKIEFTVDAEKFEEGIKKVYTQNAKYFVIPGFRKGKAPFSIVEKHYGKEIFYQDAFNEIVPEIYENAIKENKLDVVSKPNIDVVQMEKGKELIFTAIVETKPEVKVGKYKGIEIKKIEYNVTDKDIKSELEIIADKNSRLINIDNRPVKDKDTTIIDFEGFVDEKPFNGGKAENYELVIGSKSFIEGFEAQIIGMKIGEEKDIKVKFPEQYFSEELANKDAVFKVKLHEIKAKELPKIDDEFAKDVSEFNTLEELKTSIKERLEKENVSKAKLETEEEAFKIITDNTKLDIPAGMIEIEVDNIIKDIETKLSYQGMNLENYLKLTGKTIEEIRNEYKEQAEKSIKLRLVLEAIFEDAKLKVEDKEVDTKLKELATQYGKKEEELKANSHLLEHLKENLKTEIAIKFVIDNAIIK